MGTIQLNRTKVGAVPGALADGELYIDQLNGKLYWVNAAGAVQSTNCIGISTFAPSASTDTTNASNISSGTLAPARGGCPTGMLAPFPISTVPSGWLYCNGQAVNRTTYAALFAYISTAYGAGDGSTTFNLPDYRGCFLRGFDDGRGLVSNAVGAYQADAFASHTHTVTDPGHVHYTGVSTTTPGGSFPAMSTAGSSVSSTVAYTGITLANSGSGTDTRPKNYGVIFCIKT